MCAWLAAGAPSAAEPPADAPDRRLKELESALEKGQAKQQEIHRRAAALAQEMNGLRADMVAAAHAVQEREESLSELEQQLGDLAQLETEKKQALDLKRQQLNGVLTALQRLALRPSEALIAQPMSPADTVRSAILLRDVAPRIEESAQSLKAELDSLSSLRADIARQRKRIAATAARLDSEHQRLTAFYERKQKLQQETEAERRDTDARLQAMASEAGDLRDLLARLEQERQRREREAAEKAAAERAAAKAAREAELAAAKAARQAKQNDEQAARAAREAEAKAAKASHEAEIAAARAAPPESPGSRSFSAAEGQMPFPARGRIVERFGQAGMETSSPARGIVLETRPGAQVIAPYDGQVVFAGPFRGYGLLLIIEHAEGYHTLLAGMARVDSAVGQHLLVGEPVGVMGQAEGKPRLYVELRHNGQPVNPLPWLTAHKTKVTG
jgi:septal ring factor EnvC (AmiA/AmiB activator)